MLSFTSWIVEKTTQTGLLGESVNEETDMKEQQTPKQSRWGRGELPAKHVLHLWIYKNLICTHSTGKNYADSCGLRIRDGDILVKRTTFVAPNLKIEEKRCICFFPHFDNHYFSNMSVLTHYSPLNVHV